MTFVNSENTKARPIDAYGDVIARIAKDGVCPFCSEHLRKYHKNSIKKKIYWLVTGNMYPYKPTKHHLLIILKRHIVNMAEATAGELMELFKIVENEIKKLSIDGGTFIMRFGDTRFTGASVSHLHAHIVQSDPDDPDYDKVKGLTMRVG